MSVSNVRRISTDHTRLSGDHHTNFDSSESWVTLSLTLSREVILSWVVPFKIYIQSLHCKDFNLHLLRNVYVRATLFGLHFIIVKRDGNVVPASLGGLLVASNRCSCGPLNFDWSTPHIRNFGGMLYKQSRV